MLLEPSLPRRRKTAIPYRAALGREVGSISLRTFGLLLATVLVGACSSGDSGDDGTAADSSTSTSAKAGARLDAQIASYDLVAGKPQRVLIGLVGTNGRLVSGGEIAVFFAHLGDGSTTSATGTVGDAHQARFQPVTGSDAPTGGPKLTRPSEGIGVYAIDDATFDQAGRWGVIANVLFGKTKITAQGTFDVVEESRIPAPGDVAPVTQNPLPAAVDIASEAIDSRAVGGANVPDPLLHSTSIAAARQQGLPFVVVVSTPVYCVSRFCGPITDSVADLAGEFDGKAAFVHLEVWQNFEKKQVNEFVADWVYPDRKGDLLEPWVFVVGRDGTITHRFDNIAGDAELRAAVEEVTA